MTDPVLSEALHAWRRRVAIRPDDEHARVLLEEFDRRGRVVEAARAYVEHLNGGITQDGRFYERSGSLYAALVRALDEEPTDGG